MVAMIEAALLAGLVAGLGGRHAPPTARPATVVRAVRLAAVTGDADRKQLVTGVAGLLTERDVHGAAGGDCRGHWTPVPIRGTTEGDYLVGAWSSRWSRGPGGSVRVPTSSRSPQRTPARHSRPPMGLRPSERHAPSTGGAPRPLRGHVACQVQATAPLGVACGDRPITPPRPVDGGSDFRTNSRSPTSCLGSRPGSLPCLRGVNYFCRLTTTISAGEGAAKECRSRPDRTR